MVCRRTETANSKSHSAPLLFSEKTREPRDLRGAAERQRAPAENLAAEVGAPGGEGPESRNHRLIRLGYTSEIALRRDSLKRRKNQHLREDSNLQPAAPKLRLS